MGRRPSGTPRPKYRIKKTTKEAGDLYMPQMRILFFFWIDMRAKPYESFGDARRFVEYKKLVKEKKDVMYFDIYD